MSHSPSQVWIHAILCVSRHQPLLSEALQPRLFTLMHQFLRQRRCPLHLVNGTADHLHLLFRLHPDQSVSGLLRRLRTVTAGFIHREELCDRPFAWESTERVFSISEDQLPRTYEHIRHQKPLHLYLTLEEETETYLLGLPDSGCRA